MSALTFDFCPNTRVIQELPPDERPVQSMNGWPYHPRPKTPYQRTFKCTLYGLRWYQDAATRVLDKTTDLENNAGRLLDFYKAHRTWDSFLLNHEYLGAIRVRFNKPVVIPPGIGDSGGKIEDFEVELIEHEPSY